MITHHKSMQRNASSVISHFMIVLQSGKVAPSRLFNPTSPVWMSFSRVVSSATPRRTEFAFLVPSSVEFKTAVNTLLKVFSFFKFSGAFLRTKSMLQMGVTFWKSFFDFYFAIIARGNNDFRGKTMPETKSFLRIIFCFNYVLTTTTCTFHALYSNVY